MHIEMKMEKFKLRPVVPVSILCGRNKKKVNALVDTGSDTVFWVASETLQKDFIKQHLGDNGECSGFGATRRTGLRVDSVDLNLYGSNGVGTIFRDVPITHAIVATGGKFDLVLPYTLFLGFDLGIKRGVGGESDYFWFDTYDNRVNRGVKCGRRNDIVDTCLLVDESSEEDVAVIDLKEIGSRILGV